ncbi:hypothetical protein VB711_26410, partial [Cronbergia sp. UHCC 0137]|uniref:hypothetical protein n=1 Tax=Cronbergia sp. UHCC 0137 TaxID=3110239 RepID=UPI002B21E45E
MTPEQVLSQISNGIWVNKGGLKVPPEIISALSNKRDWLESIQPTEFSKSNLPEIYAIVDYFSDNELDTEVGQASAEILQSCYGVNKVFNSKVHADPFTSGQQKLDTIGKRKANKEDYTAAIEVNNLLIDWNKLNNSGFRNNESLYEKIKTAEKVNKDWFAGLVEDIKTIIVQFYNDLLTAFDNQEVPVEQQIRNQFINMRDKASNNIDDAIADFAKDESTVLDIFKEIVEKLKEELGKTLQSIKETIFGKDETLKATEDANAGYKEKRDNLRKLQKETIKPTTK